jgi:hypothetical protein
MRFSERNNRVAIEPFKFFVKPAVSSYRNNSTKAFITSQRLKISLHELEQ